MQIELADSIEGDEQLDRALGTDIFLASPPTCKETPCQTFPDIDILSCN
jgi:hypothetical protein